MKNKKKLLGIILILFGLLLVGLNQSDQLISTIKVSNIPNLGLYEVERDDGGYFTIVNEDGEVLDKTVRQVYIGDELIAADNRHYQITEIEGDTAFAELIAQKDLSYPSNWGRVDVPVSMDLPVQGEGQLPTIAIYHTHSAESYVPTEGEPFVQAQGEAAKGGIINVGQVLSGKLEAIGFRTVLNTNPHEPHDANAYQRSRRTAAQLLKEQPILILDVHRDAVPDPDFYRTTLAGEDVSKIRLVVGRQNQNMQANLEFAERLKAAVDETSPGLMHAIFLAKGNYNQDLAPKSILIEAGTHVTSREEAEKSMAFFAEAIPKALGVTPAPGERAPTTRGETSSIVWVIGLSLLAGGAFLLISTGSWKGAGEKLKEFVGQEWANYLGGKIRFKKGHIYQSSLNKKAFKLEEKKDAEKEPDNRDNKSDE